MARLIPSISVGQFKALLAWLVLMDQWRIRGHRLEVLAEAAFLDWNECLLLVLLLGFGGSRARYFANSLAATCLGKELLLCLVLTDAIHLTMVTFNRVDPRCIIWSGRTLL